MKHNSCISKIKKTLLINKGLCHIDYLVLSHIIEKVKPIEISASRISNKGIDDQAALISINNSKVYLISMPGNEYKFNFTLPKNQYRLRIISLF